MPLSHRIILECFEAPRYRQSTRRPASSLPIAFGGSAPVSCRVHRQSRLDHYGVARAAASVRRSSLSFLVSGLWADATEWQSKDRVRLMAMRPLVKVGNQ